MHAHRGRPFLLALIACTILLSACTIPTSHRYHIGYAFEVPNNRSVYPLAPFDIVLAVIVPFPPDYRPPSVPGSPPILNNVTFFANGEDIGAANVITVDSWDPTGGVIDHPLFHAIRVAWTPPRPGIYDIQARADLNLGTVIHGDYSYAVEICVVDDPASAPVVCAPTPTPVPFTPVPLSGHLPALPTVTATPGSQLDCPAGTYFADVTHRCIAIQIVTKKPGGGDPNCSQYGSANSCSAAGCAWSANTQSCH